MERFDHNTDVRNKIYYSLANYLAGNIDKKYLTQLFWEYEGYLLESEILKEDNEISEETFNKIVKNNEL